jgi:hypothetical protein
VESAISELKGKMAAAEIEDTEQASKLRQSLPLLEETIEFRSVSDQLEAKGRS